MIVVDGMKVATVSTDRAPLHSPDRFRVAISISTIAN
jgi:hypothetical protein